MENKIKKFVINYIEKKGKLPKDIDIDEFNYIETGYVDSIGIMKFVVEIEKEFDIEISDDEIILPKFKTIGGLVKIVREKYHDSEIPDGR